MDAIDASPKSSENSPRIRYGRDIILSFKDSVLSLNTDTFDILDLNSVAQRVNRTKSSKQLPFARGQADRYREPKGIVLGPQKRSWNTGCHVSQTGGREAAENLSRSGKSFPECRASDKFSKSSVDHRKDYRNGGRDRGSHRRGEGGFLHTYADDHYKDQRHHYEEEPEWFSAGPTTVSETIELGGMMDMDGEINLATKGSVQQNVNYKEEDVNFKRTSSLSPTLECHTSPQSLGSSKAEASDPPSETHGSRFKHLFAPTASDVPPKKEDINEQLLRLLKGTGSTSGAQPDRNNVLQVENKLRSILLGRRSSLPEEQPPPKDEKTKILTVEEIESQLSLSTPTNYSPNSTVAEEPLCANRMSVTPPKTSIEPPNQQPCDSTLASMLQSLSLRQQQSSCSRPNAAPGPWSPLGLLSNSAVRLPSSTNAMSASARINQLQQPDPSITSNFIESQGVLGKILDNALVTNHYPTQQGQPRSIPCVDSDFSARPIVSGLNAVGPNSFAPESARRPIVKSHLGFSPMDETNSEITQKLGPDQTNHHFLNSLMGHNYAASGDKASYNHVFPSTCTESRTYAHLAQPGPPCSRPTSGNAFDLLSQLMDMDRSKNPLLSVPIKPKTLEEIERQEVFNTNTYF